MNKDLTDKQADQMILFALVCWGLSCVYGPIGTIAQAFLIISLVWKCNVKVIPALIICHFTGGTITFLSERYVLLKLGIIVSPATVCIFAMFAFVVISLLRHRFDSSTARFMCLWLPAFLPALVMCIHAYMSGMRSMWTWPIFDVLVPSGYLWAVLAGKTWEQGKMYFLKRMLVLFSAVAILRTAKIMGVWNFALTPAVICLFFISMRVRLGSTYTMLGGFGSVAGLINLVFSNYFTVAAETGSAGAEELGSTFTQVAVCFFAVGLSLAINYKIILRGVIRVLPYAMLIATTSMLFYAVNVHEKFGLVDQQYRTLAERWQAKLFNDRGTIWTEGLQEIKSPPYFIKDLRAFIVDDAMIGKDKSGKYLRGVGLKLPPHNQVLYLLGRDGWWLGLVLCCFMWWMHVRAVNKATQFADDPVFLLYFLPVSMALFHVLGLTGQSTCSAAFQNHGFESTIVCGLIYGAVTERVRLARMLGWR